MSNEQLEEVGAQDIEDKGGGVNDVYGVNVAITGDLLDESTGVALIQRLVGDRHLYTAGHLPNREGRVIRVVRSVAREIWRPNKVVQTRRVGFGISVVIKEV